MVLYLSSCIGMQAPVFRTVEGKPYKTKVVKKGLALLYIIREPIASLQGRTPTIKLNGKILGDIENGGFFEISLRPGTYKIESLSSFLISGTKIKLKILQNKRYFINYEIGNFPSMHRLRGQENILNIFENVRLQKIISYKFYYENSC